MTVAELHNSDTQGGLKQTHLYICTLAWCVFFTDSHALATSPSTSVNIYLRAYGRL